jgi:hypothetical protein
MAHFEAYGETPENVMHVFYPLPCLAVALLLSLPGCSTNETETDSAAADEVQEVPKTGVGTFGGPGAFGGGQEKALPTNPGTADGR